MNGSAHAEYRFPAYKGVELRPRAFAEYGYARHETQPAGASEGSVHLADIGVEISARLRSWLEASLAGAVPIMDDDLDPANPANAAPPAPSMDQSSISIAFSAHQARIASFFAWSS